MIQLDVLYVRSLRYRYHYHIYPIIKIPLPFCESSVFREMSVQNMFSFVLSYTVTHVLQIMSWERILVLCSGRYIM
jgi:hypothetical protein